MLIGFRVVQGLGAGGLTALSQIIMADIISPRERGRYMGLFGGVMAVGTVGGPLIGGLLTDSVGWRWNFFVGVPVAIVAIILLQFTLKLPKRPARKVRIDYLGAAFLASGVSLLLVWVSLAGKNFDWWSPQTVWMVGGAILLLLAMFVTELVGEGADHPARDVQEPHVHARRHRLDLGRRRHVRDVGLPGPVHAARPRSDPDGVRTADAAR